MIATSLLSRRHFVQRSSAMIVGGAALDRASAAPVVSQSHSANSHHTVALADSALRVDPVLVKQLALRAIDAAKTAGATYADVRLTRTATGVLGRELHFGNAVIIGVGVRCLINGYWGFSSSWRWTSDEVTAVARRAVAIAKANAHGISRDAELAPRPVATGDWTTPGAIDPFTISAEEFSDFVSSAGQALQQFRGPLEGGGADRLLANGGLQFQRTEWALATSDGSYVTQTRYQSSAGDNYALRFPWSEGKENEALRSVGLFKHLSPAGKGLELFREAGLNAQLTGIFAEFDELSFLPIKAVQPGYVDVVVDDYVMAQLVSQTLGRATELDRALGYEANMSGTSFLGPNPLELLGSHQVASPLLTLTANRSLPGGCATVKWDDEGVEPNDAVLIKDGILTDYQTTREQATWLAPYYQKAGIAVRSHGYAQSETALRVPLQQRPNLVVTAGKDSLTMADMIKEVKRGVAIVDGNGGRRGVAVDWQAKTGRSPQTTTRPELREIVNGKLGALIGGVPVLSFNAPELWKNLRALGDATTAGTWGFSDVKGQPAQTTYHSVRAVPALFTRVALIDGAREQ